MQKGNAMEGPVGVRGAALNRPLPPPGLQVRSWPSGFLAASAVQSALPVTHRVLLGLDGCRWLERGSAERGQPLRWEVPWCSSHSSLSFRRQPPAGRFLRACWQSSQRAGLREQRLLSRVRPVRVQAGTCLGRCDRCLHTDKC